MYNKTIWEDRVVQKPNTYTQRSNSDGTITLTPAPGTVTAQGTPIRAEYLNKIENGIFEAQQSVENVKQNYLPKTHAIAAFGYDNVSGRITYNSNDATVMNSVNAQTSVNSTKWNNYSIWVGTQAQYNALSTKNSTTLYFIK